MSNNQNSRAATAAPNPADSQYEATKAALRSDLETGRCGVLGAIALHPELTLSEIVAVVSEVVKGRGKQ